MPEIKNTFTGGRMEKDQDERIVQNGLYREALNITVSTSEDSDVGAAQNILGNIKVTEAINGPKNRWDGCTFEQFPALNGRYFGTNTHIAAVIDKETDMMYRFISTIPNAIENHGVWMDRIVEYDTTARKEIQWFRKERDLNNPKKQNSIAVSKRTIDIHKMWNKGYSVYKIAKTLELNPGSVDYHLKKTLDKDTVS